MNTTRRRSPVSVTLDPDILARFDHMLDELSKEKGEKLSRSAAIDELMLARVERHEKKMERRRAKQAA